MLYVRLNWLFVVHLAMCEYNERDSVCVYGTVVPRVHCTERAAIQELNKRPRLKLMLQLAYRSVRFTDASQVEHKND